MRKWLSGTGLRQTDLARAIRRSDPTVCCWLSGKNFPDVVSAGVLEDFSGGAVPARAWSQKPRRKKAA